jgi:ribokinase
LDRPPRIGVIGDAGVDLTLVVSSGPDEKAVVGGAERGLGGTGANAATAAAKLGADVRFVSTVGDDAFGPWVLEALRAANIGVDHVRTVVGRTEVAVVLIEETGRRLFVDVGVGYEFDGKQVDQLRGWSDVIYLTHTKPELVRLASRARDGRLTVVGVEARELDLPGWARCLENVDVVITNEAGAPAALAPNQRGRPAVLSTKGAAGAILIAGDVQIVIPAPSVVALDATGAGDCLAGTLCHYLGRGLDLGSAARRAVFAASVSTTRLGTQTAFPTMDEIETHFAHV